MELNEQLSAARRRRESRRFLFARGLFALVIGLIIIFIVWIFFRSPLFRFHRIVVVGNSVVPSSTIVGLAETMFARHHHGFGMPGIQNMLMWPSSISPEIVQLEPRLESAVLTKSYSAHTITMSVVERQPIAIWCLMSTSAEIGSLEGESCYWFDKSGTVFEKGFDTEGGLISVVHDYAQSHLAIGRQILSARFLPNILSILGAIRSSGLRVKEVRLNDLSLEEVVVKTYNGPDIYFSLRFPADDTVSVLEDIVHQNGFGNFEYVDFRTQGRAYYK